MGSVGRYRVLLMMNKLVMAWLGAVEVVVVSVGPLLRCRLC